MKSSIKKNSDIVTAGVLEFLSETGRQSLLSDVAESLDELASKTRKAEKIEVTSVVSLKPDQEAIIKKVIQKTLNLDLPLKNNINKTLIGGFTLRVGDWFMDASLLYELNKLKQNLLI